jgi:hypothetical protein
MSFAAARAAVITMPRMSWPGGWPVMTCQRAGSGDYLAPRALVRQLAHRYMGAELRERAEAADPDRRLARWLARQGRLDELRQRARRGDEHARCLLAGGRWQPAL